MRHQVRDLICKKKSLKSVIMKLWQGKQKLFKRDLPYMTSLEDPESTLKHTVQSYLRLCYMERQFILKCILHFIEDCKTMFIGFPRLTNAEYLNTKLVTLVGLVSKYSCASKAIGC